MATGKLASLDISNAATDTLFYTIPTNMTSSFSMCATNRTASPVTIRIAFTTTGTITADEYVAYEAYVYPNEVYERSGFVLTQGQFVYVRSSATGVNFVAWGYEET
jgi:hypothetical protein